MENVIIWSLSDNKILYKVSVPPQVAVIKLGFPDILVCGHLDGFVTTIHFKYIAAYDPDSASRFDALDCRRTSFRGHTSAVITLEFNKVSEINITI